MIGTFVLWHWLSWAVLPGAALEVPAEISIRGSVITLSRGCQLTVKAADGRVEELATNLPEVTATTRCQFVPHGGTNVVHLEFVAGRFIVLVNAMDEIDAGSPRHGCKSRTRALAVDQKGKAMFATKYQSALSCDADRDRKTFEYLAKAIPR
jgi:hypothetical protein